MTFTKKIGREFVDSILHDSIGGVPLEERIAKIDFDNVTAITDKKAFWDLWKVIKAAAFEAASDETKQVAQAVKELMKDSKIFKDFITYIEAKKAEEANK